MERRDFRDCEKLKTSECYGKEGFQRVPILGSLLSGAVIFLQIRFVFQARRKKARVGEVEGDNCMPGTQFNPEPGLLHCLIIIGPGNKLWHKAADRGLVIMVRLSQ